MIRVRRTLLCLAASALLLGSPLLHDHAQAAAANTGSKMSGQAAADKAKVTAGETIRAALFANLGNKSPGHTQQVTLTSPETITVQARTAQNGLALGISQARYSMDQYQIKVIETKDKATAQAVLKKVQASDSARLIHIPRRGATFYAVYAGYYNTENEASQALKRYEGDASIQASLQGARSTIAGPHYLQAGTYNSLAEAKTTLQLLLDASFDANVVIIQSSGKTTAAVWVGQASSQAALDKVQATVGQALPAVNVRPVQATGALVQSLEDTGSGTISHYRVYGNEKWGIEPAKDSTIKVTERSQRTYRGLMEVSVHNKELALVNELPLEQYLVSVVGGEVYSSWPAETLKAQAVAARTFALYQNGKFEIANVVDTTLSQAYYGTEKEHSNIKSAVEATAGEVLTQNGKLIEAIFNSNAGGKTADPSEVWGGSYGYFQVVDSPDDVIQEGKKNWYYVALPSGALGYVREDVVTKEASRNKAGLQIAYPKENGTNIRPIPAIQSNVNPVAQADKGTGLIVLNTVPESTEYAWMRGPYTAQEVTNMIKSSTKTAFSGTVQKLAVTSRGPSGRVTKMEVNGVPIQVSYPDSFRSVFGGLPSTLFEVVSSSNYTVAGASGKSTDKNGISGGTAVDGKSSSPQNLKDGAIAINGKGEAKAINSQPTYFFKGKGYGHGVGLSQWGAKGLADKGYDYQKILKYYYKNVELIKR
ncbi:SpoIID/LytB domain-containing protein [Paenibacillus sp. ACRRX]|uniref:SpoIID/LytB domain-containing protein n=1 Tax=Paenibacillus sp. ACRRX TaxID=2918206 RepID=UPI001EF6EA7E|nr:SpoIID/LytB domain-containing protein [Paenibacillus sp. ACRRX]MCG7410352.1 SpoIID/LytB domain-containing protein [Paenibacillus sp. ACRRX]